MHVQSEMAVEEFRRAREQVLRLRHGCAEHQGADARGFREDSCIGAFNVGRNRRV